MNPEKFQHSSEETLTTAEQIQAKKKRLDEIKEKNLSKNVISSFSSNSEDHKELLEKIKLEEELVELDKIRRKEEKAARLEEVRKKMAHGKINDEAIPDKKSLPIKVETEPKKEHLSKGEKIYNSYLEDPQIIKTEAEIKHGKTFESLKKKVLDKLGKNYSHSEYAKEYAQALEEVEIEKATIWDKFITEYPEKAKAYAEQGHNEIRLAFGRTNPEGIPTKPEENKSEFVEKKTPELDKSEVIAAEAKVEKTPSYSPSPEVLEKLKTIKGLTPEMLASIPEFADIADSEGKVYWMLEKLQNVKLRSIDKEAREGHEKHVREAAEGSNNHLLGKAKVLFKKIGRNAFRDGKIQARRTELIDKDFNLDFHREDIKDLIHLADAGPDMKLEKDDKGKTELIAQYLHDPEGVHSQALDSFNKAATAYAKLPPEYEWSKKDKETYFTIKNTYENEKKKALNEIKKSIKTEQATNSASNEPVRNYSDNEALLIVNQADFEMKTHQSLNNYPNAELELKKLAEKKGWFRQKAEAVTQGAIAMKTGLASAGIRVGVKSIIGAAAGAAALPLTSLALGASFGAWRGYKGGEKNLKREEELMRLGFEGQTNHGRRLDPLMKQRNDLRKALEKETDPKKIKTLNLQLYDNNEELKNLNAKNTNRNFLNADDAIEKINHLNEYLRMDHATYVRHLLDRRKNYETKFSVPTENEFAEKQRDWQEKLDVRLEFTKRKLEEGKIGFGKEEEALKKRLDLIQTMGEATATSVALPDHQEKVFERTYGNKTRRSALEKVLVQAESKISKNQSWYKVKQAGLGTLTGGTFAFIGSEAGGLLRSGIESSSAIAHDVHVEAHNIMQHNYQAGKVLEKTFNNAVHNNVAHTITRSMLLEEHHAAAHAASIIQPHVSSAVEAPASTSQVIESNGSSREYELIKFYEQQLSGGKPITPEIHHQAGTLANQKMHELFGNHGEEGIDHAHRFVHKGDHIIINEQNGEVKKVDLIPKGQPIPEASTPHVEVSQGQVVTPAGTSAEAPEIVTADAHVPTMVEDNHPAAIEIGKTLRGNPAYFGYAGDPNNEAQLNIWALKTSIDIQSQNFDIVSSTLNKGDNLEIIHTTAGKWHLEVKHGATPAPTPSSVSPEVIDQTPAPVEDLLASYSVDTPTSVPEVLEKILEKDPRFVQLNSLSKDRVLYTLFVKNYLNHATDKDFNKNIGIDGLFEVKPGTMIHLDGNLEGDEDSGSMITDALDSLKSNQFPEGLDGFAEHAGEVARVIKGAGAQPQSWDGNLIIRTLRIIKEAQK
jgi:hypothetical protein